MAMKDDWARARNILVMRLDNIGDVIMTSPALCAIKANLTEARVTLLASPAGAQAAPLLPWVDDVLVWRTLWQDLGRLEFDPAREWELVSVLRERHLTRRSFSPALNRRRMRRLTPAIWPAFPCGWDSQRNGAAGC